MSFNNKSVYSLYLRVLTALLVLSGCAHAGEEYSLVDRHKQLVDKGTKVFIAVDKDGAIVEVTEKGLLSIPSCDVCDKKAEKKWGKNCKKLIEAAKKNPDIFKEAGICRGLVAATTKSKNLIGISKTHANPTCLSVMTSAGIRERCW